jgi:hypothetical protein
MAELFEKDTDTIGLHIRNAFREGELSPEATTEESSVVQVEGKRRVRRTLKTYNLDVVISVGCRVKSVRGKLFRIWSTRVLRDHILAGYSVNEQLLRDLSRAVRLVADISDRRGLSGEEATALLHVVADYSYAFEVLDNYDHQRVLRGEVTPEPVSVLGLEEARAIVNRMRDRFGGSALFGVGVGGSARFARPVQPQASRD